MLVRVAACGLTVLLVEHDMPLVMQACSALVAMDNGRVLCAGSVAAVRAAYAGCHYFSPKIAAALASRRHLGVSPLDQLSQREREILQLIVEGRSSAQIAQMLTLSPKTVETYRSRMMRKLGFRDLFSLVKLASGGRSAP